ncbi:MAG: sensor histidine kinase [Alphaproteobacteria bacterium]
MSSFPRIFTLISLLVVLAVSIAGGYFYHKLSMQQMIAISEQSKQSVAVGFTHNVWNYYRNVIVPLSTKNPDELRTNTDVATFARHTMQYFQNMPLVRVNIYNSAGLLLMMVDGKASIKLAAAVSPDKSFVVQETRSGRITTNVLVEGQPNDAILTQTMLPVRSPEGELDGVIEIIEDITPQAQQIEQSRYIGMAVLVAMFVMFLLINFLTSRKTESIITKLHETNLELAAAAEAAQAENMEKSKFLANVSHELRTPLNAIIGFSDIIKNEVVAQLENKKYHDYINDIHTSGVHLLSLINDILDYSKAEAGKLELEVSEVNASKLVQNCMRLVASRAEDGGVQLVENMPKEAFVMLTDSKKLKQVFLNLLSNAVKFTHAEGEVRISGWRNAADDSFSFEVRDTGIGIAPKDISRAMSPFGQVDNDLSRKYEGTGLGLPLTKKFVELMGGKFSIESEVGVGTTITFTLPREIKEREGIIVKYLS